jgi:hypothetical protein
MSKLKQNTLFQVESYDGSGNETKMDPEPEEEVSADDLVSCQVYIHWASGLQ